MPAQGWKAPLWTVCEVAVAWLCSGGRPQRAALTSLTSTGERPHHATLKQGGGVYRGPDVTQLINYMTVHCKLYTVRLEEKSPELYW